MKFWSDSFKDGAWIPEVYAFGAVDATSHVRLSGNRNPHLAWSGLPAGTRSLALICCDGDVPSRGDDVNQEGRVVPADLPRVDFYHWTLIDLTPNLACVPAGAFSDGIVARGKPGPECSAAGMVGARQGLNDYTAWFAGDPRMVGDYFGYDGPCPPWNDEIVHHYVFTLYALDIEHVPVVGKFTGAQALQAMQGHILSTATLTGRYALNPAVLARWQQERA